MDKTRSRRVNWRWALLPVMLFSFLFPASRANAAAQAGQPISQVVVLGDSLSDNGNLYTLIGYPPPPCWLGRASNGPVAVEYLAQKMGVFLADFAWAGATTGVGNVVDGGTAAAPGAFGLPGMTTAFQNAFPAGPIDTGALYFLWGGAMDFFSLTGPAEASIAIGKAATNLRNMVVTLQSRGAVRIVVLNMPNLGKTPLVLSKGPLAASFFKQVSVMFNQVLKSSLPAGVHYVDIYSLFEDLTAHPEEYGIANVTGQLQSSPGADPNTYFFWDGTHPTTAGHAIIADVVYRSTAPTVLIGEWDSGVPNALLSSGATISDLIAQAEIEAKNHGEFVSAVASITNGLILDGIISGAEKGAIESCAARR